MEDISKFDDYDCLVIGGGAVFLRHWTKIHYEHCLIAAGKGKKVRIFNVGVMDDVENWDLAKKIFEMSDKFTVRSKASFDSFKRGTGCEPEIDGFHSKYCKKVSKKRVDEILNSSEIDKNKILVGVQCKNVESVIRYYTPICKHLLDNENVELVGINTFIPKVDEKNSDSTAIDTINNNICVDSNTGVNNKKRLIKKINGRYNGLLHPHEMKGVLAKLDYLIANRKHPAITADSEGVKVLLVDNDGAIGRIKEYINSIFYVDINVDSDPNKLIDVLKDIKKDNGTK